MPIKRALSYYRSIHILEAKEAMKQLHVVSYPHIKEKDRKELYKSYRKVADQGKEEKKDIVKVDDMISKLNHGR
jgi:hypothetical protein